MIYTDFQNIKLPYLGLGMMKLPVIDGDDSKIDEAATAEIIDYAYKIGVNYSDAACNSELTAGKFLSKYPKIHTILPVNSQAMTIQICLR